MRMDQGQGGNQVGEMELTIKAGEVEGYVDIKDVNIEVEVAREDLLFYTNIIPFINSKMHMHTG